MHEKREYVYDFFLQEDQNQHFARERMTKEQAEAFAEECELVKEEILEVKKGEEMPPIVCVEHAEQFGETENAVQHYREKHT